MKRVLMCGFTLCLSAPVWANSAPVYNGVYWPAERVGQQVLMKNKYHDIQITSMQARRCPSGGWDENATNFRAISSQDHMVSGYTCGGNVYPTLTTVTEPTTI